MRPNHQALLNEAFLEAAGAIGNSDPNPAVGAVIFDKDRSQIIGRGHTAPAGGPHAEVAAIQDALTHFKPEALKSSALYVTLEPCSHFGRTPPCTDLILKHEIGEVHIACKDPTEKVRGIERLRRARVSVYEYSAANFQEEVFWSLGPFFHMARYNRPRVLLKWAMTAGGKLAPASGPSGAISSAESREVVGRLRELVHGVLATPGTVRADRPRLNSRYGEVSLLGKFGKANGSDQPGPVGTISYFEKLLLSFEEARGGAGAGNLLPVRFLMIPRYDSPSDKRSSQNLCDENDVDRWDKPSLIEYAKMQTSLPGKVCFLTDDDSQYQALAEIVSHAENAAVYGGIHDFNAALECISREGCLQVMVEAGPEYAEKLWQENIADVLLCFHSPVAPEWETGGRDFSLSKLLVNNLENGFVPAELKRRNFVSFIDVQVGPDRLKAYQKEE